jgi:hypothetical protein
MTDLSAASGQNDAKGARKKTGGRMHIFSVQGFEAIMRNLECRLAEMSRNRVNRKTIGSG